MRHRVQGIPSIDELAYTPLGGCRGQHAAGCGASGCGSAYGYYYREHSMYSNCTG